MKENNMENTKTDLQVLYEKFYPDNQIKDYKHFIDLYEENKLFIEKTIISFPSPEYDAIIRITADYAIALSRYGSSKKSIPFLDKAIQIWQAYSQKDLVKIPIYETLIWTRGTENYNAKNYNKALEDFDFLVANYPDNDKYRNWLVASKTNKNKKYSNFLLGVMLVGIFVHAFLKKEDVMLKLIFLWTAAGAIVIWTIIEIYNYFIKRKIKNSH